MLWSVGWRFLVGLTLTLWVLLGAGALVEWLIPDDPYRMMVGFAVGGPLGALGVLITIAWVRRVHEV